MHYGVAYECPLARGHVITVGIMYSRAAGHMTYYDVMQHSVTNNLDLAWLALHD